MTIRPATPGDAPAIARVHTQSWRETYAGLVPPAFLHHMTGEERRAQSERGWRAAATREGQVLLVTERAGEVTGFIAGGPARDFPGYGGEVYALYLLRAAQGEGAGRALVQALARALHALGHRNLMLWVLATNPTRAFYAHLGGQALRERTEVIPEGELRAVAYGWPDLGALT